MHLTTILAWVDPFYPVAHYLNILFRKTPFEGLYQPNAFDLSFLIPYFVSLGVLSIYGVHRYVLTYLYLKHRRNRAGRLEFLEPLPRITVQLPLYNERYVIGRLLEAVARIDYPRDLLEIQVLDDSTDDTRFLCSRLVSEYQEAGFRITYQHRPNRQGYKAGALAQGLKTATGEFIAIFDADFVPPPSILRDMLPYFADPQIAVVQGRWTWINRHYSNLTEVEAIMLDAHFMIEHGARNWSGRFFNFNGTAGMWRRIAIEDAGGWQHDTLTEDTDLSYRAQLQGWKFVYDPSIECPSELPVEMNAFKSQQARWAKGLIQTARKLLPRIWASGQPLSIKIEATLHLTANISYPLMVVFSLILFPAIVVRFYQGWFQMLYLDLPMFLASTCSVGTFYMVAQRSLNPRGWRRQIKYIPCLMAAGIGLSIVNAKAVIEALLDVQSEFVRTAKYRVEGRNTSWEGRKYQKKGGWIPAVELGLAVYFFLTAAYSITIQNYITTPFVLLFFGGYGYMGSMSLLQTPLRRLWKALPVTLGPRPVANEVTFTPELRQ
jgi:cellulose synthase/poly-beta-1,6-N-acetylglucosamine synthase-like glycosyltransferase